MEKLIKIVIGEFSTAFFFIIMIIILEEMSKAMPTMPNLIPALITMWILIGIATPIVIFFEIEEMISDLFRR